MRKLMFFLTGLIFLAMACNNNQTAKKAESPFKKEVDKYFTYELNTDLSVLSDNQKKMLKLLFQVADIMDSLFWEVAADGYKSIYDTLSDEYAKKLFLINYGPWNRLDGNKPFIPGVGEKPLGAFFYPVDMTKEEFEQWDNPDKTSLYTIIRRDSAGNLVAIPYSQYFKPQLQRAHDLLLEAAKYAEDPDFKHYLELRAEALITDNYFDSDTAWLNMKNNIIDFVVGPIENYEDGLFGYKTAFEAFILVKDMEWSKKLAKYAKLLPDLQKQLPVPDQYKQEEPGTNSELNAYDAIYYAGDCNAGSKTIAINLPNDEKVQLLKGSRRLQLKNAMRAKFDSIVIPISNILIAPDQRKYVKFDAFFANTMFHEVAHGLGIKNTINGKGTCREALQETYNTFEEGKADILGLWLITKLKEMNEFETDLMTNYVTFVASIFRSIRFGASSAHGRANLIRYNFFMEQGAITRNDDGTYTINPDKLLAASDSLARLILTIQGDGDKDKALQIMDKYMVTPDYLKQDLKRLEDANIPVDVVWKQGPDVLGL